MRTVLDKLTVAEKLLLVGYNLEEQGDSPFSLERLIVDAWKKFPQAFGLQEYMDEHPDSNKVIAALAGRRGPLHKQRWFTKIGMKLYALTEKGRSAAKTLQQV